MNPILHPADTPLPPAGRPHGDRADAGGALTGRSVLLAEDEAFIAMDLRYAIEDAGGVVTHARTQAEGLAYARAQRFDAAVLDVNLGGGETCAPIADLLREAGTPYVLHSGDLDRQGETIRALSAPIVAKPADPERVVRALVAVVTGAKAS